MKNILPIMFSLVYLANGDTLSIDFNDQTYSPLVRTFGPTDDLTRADSNYTVRVIDGRAHYIAPGVTTTGPRLSGFLDLPQNYVPISGSMTHRWTFPVVNNLLSLGTGDLATKIAVAGCYIRGDLDNWVGGTFGDYWFGFVNNNGTRISTIRQGNSNLQTEPFTAIDSVSYEIRKINDDKLQLWAKYDIGNWHQVGQEVTIQLNTSTANASYNVAITHIRILDLSGIAIDVVADNLVWIREDASTNIKKGFYPDINSLLCQNYPNPLSGSTVVSYYLAGANFVNLAVYNTKGELVKVLVNKTQAAGSHSVIFDASNLRSGIYTYQLNIAGKVMFKKMSIIK